MKATKFHKSGGNSGKSPAHTGPMSQMGASNSVPAAVSGFNQGNTMPNADPNSMVPNYK